MSKATRQQSLSTLVVDNSENHWRNIRLKELLTIQYGSSLPGNIREKGSVPVYGSNGIVGYHCVSCVNGPGIIIGRKGSVGAISLCNSNFWPIDTTYYIEESDRYDIRWLYYVLDTLELPKLNSATGVPGINRDDIYQKRIFLPPPQEQRRIAAILTISDEAIAATDGVVKYLEAVRESTSRKLFTQGIGHTDFVRTRLGLYPRAWDLKPMGEIADIGSGTALGRKFSGQIIRFPYLRVANVQDGYLDLSEIKYIDILESEREKWLLEVGDILLTEGGDWDKLGRGTIWNGEIENCIHQNHIFRVRLVDPAFDVRFVHYLLSSFYGKAYFKQASKQSTNLASINQKQLRSFVVLQPPLEEQRRIAATLSAFDDRLTLERAERDRLVALKKGLMQVLLTGKVRVPPGVAEEVAPAHA